MLLGTGFFTGVYMYLYNTFTVWNRLAITLQVFPINIVQITCYVPGMKKHEEYMDKMLVSDVVHTSVRVFSLQVVSSRNGSMSFT